MGHKKDITIVCVALLMYALMAFVGSVCAIQLAIQ